MKHTNKIRNMQGVVMGRGSAGRVKPSQSRAPEGPPPDSFNDVHTACKNWLIQHGHKVGFNSYNQQFRS